LWEKQPDAAKRRESGLLPACFHRFLYEYISRMRFFDRFPGIFAAPCLKMPIIRQ
jgi:hypothetical protein